jgi:hypothetical protein
MQYSEPEHAAYEAAKLPDDFVAAVVAHELTHAWEAALKANLTEDEVDELVDLVGLPMHELRRFLAWVDEQAEKQGLETCAFIDQAEGWREGWRGEADG